MYVRFTSSGLLDCIIFASSQV